MNLLGERPLGFVIISVWTGLLGISSLVLSIPESLIYLPIGLLYVVGAYGLWRQAQRGAVILVVAWVVGAIESAILRGNPLVFVGVALISGYLYYRRDDLSGGFLISRQGNVD